MSAISTTFINRHPAPLLAPRRVRPGGARGRGVRRERQRVRPRVVSQRRAHPRRAPQRDPQPYAGAEREARVRGPRL